MAVKAAVERAAVRVAVRPVEAREAARLGQVKAAVQREEVRDETSLLFSLMS